MLFAPTREYMHISTLMSYTARCILNMSWSCQNFPLIQPDWINCLPTPVSMLLHTPARCVSDLFIRILIRFVSESEKLVSIVVKNYSLKLVGIVDLLLCVNIPGCRTQFLIQTNKYRYCVAVAFYSCEWIGNNSIIKLWFCDTAHTHTHTEFKVYGIWLSFYLMSTT